ncbi:MAG TPA: alpha/beta hydrolase [Soehngenia sp.]|nr:alpha/beta hydrolase [Soehngenia sp.]HPP31264.1 alpha/beta hydrolase [Soehngenia sp.]
MRPLKKLTLNIISKVNINVKEHYKSYRLMQKVVNPAIAPVYKKLDEKIYLNGNEIPVRLFIPEVQKNSQVLLFFHGGGWVTGDIDSYTNLCSRLANETNRRVISVDYRLAPEYPYPSGLEDCYQVAKYLFNNLHLLSCSKEDIILIGDSAGGNLAACVSLLLRDKKETVPKKQVLIYPATNYDHTESSPYKSVVEFGEGYILTSKRIQDYMELYVPNYEDRVSPYVAPILSKDLSNQPETLIITAEYDPLRDEGEAYGKKLESFGNTVHIFRVKDAVHGYLNSPIESSAIRETYTIISKFLDNLL